VESEVAGDEEQEARHDRAVDAKRPTLAQTRFPSAVVTGTRAPQEHTRLRNAHPIFRRRPQEGHPMYWPAS
jgi:hypothetical protein